MLVLLTCTIPLAACLCRTSPGHRSGYAAAVQSMLPPYEPILASEGIHNRSEQTQSKRRDAREEDNVTGAKCGHCRS